MQHEQPTGYEVLDITAAALRERFVLDSLGTEIVQTCMSYLYTSADEDDAIRQVLAYLGTQFGCARVSTFSVRRGRWISADLEWCAEGFSAQKDQLRNELIDHLNVSRESLSRRSLVLLRDVEGIRNTHPISYAMMKSRQATSVLSMLMQFEHEDLGLVTMENPTAADLDRAIAVLLALEQALHSQMRRRQMLHELEEMSFHDPMTGAYNRNALAELYRRPLAMRSVGVIFCDVSGLKQVNDTLGHEVGDEMIIQCHRLIQQNVRTDHIYRMGGDEFLALCYNCTKEEIEQDYARLKHAVSESEHHIAVGYVWSDEAPLMLEPLIAQADQEMYRNKQAYYSTRDYFARMAREVTAKGAVLTVGAEDTAFQRYIKDYYFDAEALMRSLTINNTNQFFFFGDIQKNYFYVSDMMRDRFGFESNLIVNLPHYWEQCICDEEYKRLNSEEVERMFMEKRDTYEVLHILQDVHGNRIWAYNSGTLQWNVDKTVPLFLSGRITLQDKGYAVDQISGFQKDHKALSQLEEIQRAGQKTPVIGFCLNHMDKVNHSDPTYYGNLLMYHTGQHLLSELSGQVTFYRLEGTCFIAVMHPEVQADPVQVLERIRNIVEEEYKAAEVYEANPASFALLKYEASVGTPQEFLETVYETIDTARELPHLPYATVSEERRREIEQIEKMAAVLRRDVKNGMENFRIVVVPAVWTDTGALAGGESVLRWTYQGREVTNAELTPLLEKEGLMVQVNRWAMEQALRAGAQLRDCAKEFTLAFNISEQTLSSEGIVDFMRELVERYNVQSQTFFAEVLETHMLARSGKLTEFAKACQEMGIHIMQKRFASLNAPFRAAMEPETSVVKLSAQLLHDLPTGEEQEKYLQSLAFTCRTFGKKFSVNDIKTEEEHRKAVACGCDYLQGSYYSNPLELTELYALLLK